MSAVRILIAMLPALALVMAPLSPVSAAPANPAAVAPDDGASPSGEVSPVAPAGDVEPASPGRSLTEPVGLGDYLRMFAGLAVILVLIAGMAWTMRRMGRFSAGAQGALRIVAGLSLGQRDRVVLLQVGKEQILVGVSQAGVRRLHKLESPIDAEAAQPAEAAGESFAARLAAVLRGQGGKP